VTNNSFYTGDDNSKDLKLWKEIKNIFSRIFDEERGPNIQNKFFPETSFISFPKRTRSSKSCKR
jgi:hypothetical protein